MASPLSRRDFLKVAGLFSLGSALHKYRPPSLPSVQDHGENVLILLFDAWSAQNMSLYGYKRETTPNLSRLAEKAIVYHRHFAGGHFTPPGTASLLTGTSSWTHRAFKYKSASARLSNNIFSAFAPYHRWAYTHNPLADDLLWQMLAAIDDHVPLESLYLKSDPLINTLFDADEDTALVAWRRALKRLEEGHSYSLYLSPLYQYFHARDVAELEPQFPRGLPMYEDLGLNFFTLEQGIDWLANLMPEAPSPSLGYVHFLPPHDPYNSRKDFIDTFAQDGYTPPTKPLHVLEHTVTERRRRRLLRWYDEFILYVDAEFARLFDLLERSGVLENTWLVLTTDHGEMFERGILGHVAPVFHQPISHIPLLIFPPGGDKRIDVNENTSAMDLLPTLLHVTGQTIPSWAEGRILPPFTDVVSEAEEDITNLQVERFHQNGSVAQATCMLVRGNLKLMWYFGHPQIEDEHEFVELYDLETDPGEVDNLYPRRKDIAKPMMDALQAKLNAFNRETQQSAN